MFTVRGLPTVTLNPGHMDSKMFLDLHWNQCGQNKMCEFVLCVCELPFHKTQQLILFLITLTAQVT